MTQQESMPDPKIGNEDGAMVGVNAIEGLTIGTGPQWEPMPDQRA